ncbi:MAG TPA: GspE/PulE family protein [bacterium]|nr:GspE/PulE family protein [bacterium]HPT30001.1 GspE/PulE family protein [bacterium]
MLLDNNLIKKILLEESYVSASDMAQADDYVKKNGLDLIDYLLSEEILSNDLLGQALAEYYNLPYADLNSNPVSPEQVKKIPEKFGRELRAVFFGENGKQVFVTTDTPQNPELKKIITPLFPGKKVSFLYSLSEDIDTSLNHYRQALNTRFAGIIKEGERVAPEIIDEILADAINYRASDIHFEPDVKEVLVRFRIDGVLQEAGRIPQEFFDNILNRIKVQSRLRTDEHYGAQDGSIRYLKGNSVVDLRVSIIPTVTGEKIVIRLLAQYIRGFNLGDLGLSEPDQAILSKTSDLPFGMILVVGPTGSGKTTTLYALLKKLNRPEVNITTIEDPVEYKVKGINQIQVNLQTNLTFAKGLKSIVRQDPDIILVGEIRDNETAEIGVNAALTGHLLLSTFHANDAATAVPRLLDMGIEPFLLASTLELIVAQRLVRKVCESCRVSHQVANKDLLNRYSFLKPYLSGAATTLYSGKGCPVCNYSGYKDRVAIFEMIKVTPEIEDLILHRPASKEVWQLARAQGSHSLFEDGWDKIRNGITTIDEVLRVAEAPQDDKKIYGKK